ncbi:hypothetical protein GT037_008107, partial [Alternaria burnsii]
YMAESLHTVVEGDGILPNVVYTISIPMTDANWAKYKQLLAVFGFASGMDAKLEHVEGWKALASASKRDLDMAILSPELIQIWKGMWVEGGAGYPGTLQNSEQ